MQMKQIQGSTLFCANNLQFHMPPQQSQDTNRKV